MVPRVRISNPGLEMRDAQGRDFWNVVSCAFCVDVRILPRPPSASASNPNPPHHPVPRGRRPRAPPSTDHMTPSPRSPDGLPKQLARSKRAFPTVRLSSSVARPLATLLEQLLAPAPKTLGTASASAAAISTQSIRFETQMLADRGSVVDDIRDLSFPAYRSCGGKRNGGIYIKARCGAGIGGE